MMRRIAPLLTGLVLLAGCDGAPVPTENAAHLAAARPAYQSAAALERDLATLRRVTAPFHDFEVASDAGWSAPITGCMTDPTLGGMGFHYGNVGLIDGVARVDEPELLLYQPVRNGRLQLVAVEYIIPYTFVSRDSPAPELFGQKFQQNDVFQLWGLHVWVWKQNPSGLFAPWNPRVTCPSGSATTMGH